MACGTPVITSSVTSLPEVVGGAAVLVDPLQTESITEALGRVIADSSLREKLSRDGLERVKNLTWENTATATWKVLQQHLN
jgi:glycosyltransferase involved in cell wall biosynthesis